MSDANMDEQLRETLLRAFPAPAAEERGDWQRVLSLAANRPTLVGREQPLRIGRRRMRLVLAAAAMAVFLLAAGVAIAAGTGVRIPGLGFLFFEPHPIPAQMLGPDFQVPVGLSVLPPTNGWQDSDGYTIVNVYAGAAGNPTGSSTPTNQGRVMIVRTYQETGKQSITYVDAGPTGALTITNAPLGAAVEKSAVTGDLDLHAADGESLVLHLSTNTITGQ